mmetsp:Transcript_26417/g.77026  ORF Transcript_26417/g.77026 Transcript_26417/m.77026 type:complete len:221 (+) Transcript_26417:1696-2358(+)
MRRGQLLQQGSQPHTQLVCLCHVCASHKGSITFVGAEGIWQRAQIGEQRCGDHMGVVAGGNWRRGIVGKVVPHGLEGRRRNLPPEELRRVDGLLESPHHILKGHRHAERWREQGIAAVLLRGRQPFQRHTPEPSWSRRPPHSRGTLPPRRWKPSLPCLGLDSLLLKVLDSVTCGLCKPIQVTTEALESALKAALEPVHVLIFPTGQDGWHWCRLRRSRRR